MHFLPTSLAAVQWLSQLIGYYQAGKGDWIDHSGLRVSEFCTIYTKRIIGVNKKDDLFSLNFRIFTLKFKKESDEIFSPNCLT